MTSCFICINIGKIRSYSIFSNNIILSYMDMHFFIAVTDLIWLQNIAYLNRLGKKIKEENYVHFSVEYSAFSVIHINTRII